MRMLGIEHSTAKKVRDKTHEHTIACADKLMKSRRMLERSTDNQNRKRPRADTHRSMTKISPTELLSWDSSPRSSGSRYDA